MAQVMPPSQAMATPILILAPMTPVVEVDSVPLSTARPEDPLP